MYCQYLHLCFIDCFIPTFLVVSKWFIIIISAPIRYEIQVNDLDEMYCDED